MKWIALAVLATGCMSIAHDAKPSRREATVAIAAGLTASAAAFAGAQLAHDPPSIATQAAVTTGVAFLPVAAMFLADESSDDGATTEGEVYSRLASVATGGILEAIGFSLLATAPMIASVASGNETARPNGRQYGAVVGTFVGLATSAAVAAKMPKWARVVVGTAITGSLTTLGYQLGGGPPR